MASDSSANALGSAAGRSSRSSAAQRAADSAPSWGMVAPASTPPAAMSQYGAPAVTRTSSVATAAAWASSVGGSTRLWPKRSISRASCGPATASATANPPVTSPAVAKEPVRACTSQTMPKLVMAMPTRPAVAVRKKAAAPGARNRVR